MKVYIVWYTQKWELAELCSVFENEEDANKQKDFLNTQRTEEEKEQLDAEYIVQFEEVHSSFQTTKVNKDE